MLCHKLVMSFPQDNSIASEGLVNEEINSTKLGLKGIPALAEELQVARNLFLLEYTGGKLHIPTISTQGSIKLIKEAKAKGLQVSCSERRCQFHTCQNQVPCCDL